MSYPINYPTPQGANIQIFKEGGSTSDWAKPQGASFVWFTLIGGGGAGGGGGGGSGAATNFMGPAFLMPDVLRVSVGKGGVAANGTASTVLYQQKNGTGYTLLTADFGRANGAAGAATASNYFSAMGFYQSVAGQAGSSTNISASTTTFLSGGTTSNNSISANYGYAIGGSNSGDGFFQMQPIIVGCGGSITGSDTGGKGGIGCGGGSNIDTVFGAGGDGMVVIITW